MTIATITGVPTLDEIIAAIEAFYGGQPTKKVIRNWGESDPVTDLERLAILPVRHSGLQEDGKTAMVTPDNLSFGISRMFQTFGDPEGLPFTLKVFHNLGDALQWIA